MVIDILWFSLLTSTFIIPVALVFPNRFSIFKVLNFCDWQLNPAHLCMHALIILAANGHLSNRSHKIYTPIENWFIKSFQLYDTKLHNVITMLAWLYIHYNKLIMLAFEFVNSYDLIMLVFKFVSSYIASITATVAQRVIFLTGNG